MPNEYVDALTSSAFKPGGAKKGGYKQTNEPPRYGEKIPGRKQGSRADELAAAEASGETTSQFEAAYGKPGTATEEAATGERTNIGPNIEYPNPADLATAEGKGKGKGKHHGGGPPQPPAVTPATLPQTIQSVLAPQYGDINALAGDYNNVMGQLDALPGGIPGTGSAALNAATSATTQNLEGGELGVAKALGGMQGAAQTQVQDLPYADIFSSLLQQKKNELLYGTTTAQSTYQPSQVGWNKNLKGIYSYLEGSTTKKGATGGPPSAADTVIGAGPAVNPTTGNAPASGTGASSGLT